MSKNIIYPTETEFETMIEDNDIVFVDFWATWCGPCRMVAPVIEQIADKYADKMSVAKIDIDENPSLATKYEIQSIPTIVIIKNGKEVKREVGVRSFEDYCNMVDQIL